MYAVGVFFVIINLSINFCVILLIYSIDSITKMITDTFYFTVIVIAHHYFSVRKVQSDTRWQWDAGQSY